MRFSTDSAFHIGAQHLRSGMPCQDYAASGVLDTGGRAYAVVSDGCSSGQRTDIGARVIAVDFINGLSGGQDGVTDISGIAFSMKLYPADLYATRLSVVVTNKSFAAKVAGDGVLALAHVDGSIQMFKYEWANNMPWYPIYDLVGQREDFIAAHKSDEAFRVESWIKKDGDLSKFIDVGVPAKDSARDHCLEFKWITGIAAAAVFSDGVFQIDGMEWQDVVSRLMAFKTTEGEFVKRRMIRFLHDLEKDGKRAMDDLSVAAILIQ